MTVDMQKRPPVPVPKNRAPKQQAALGLNTQIIQNRWQNIHLLRDPRRIDFRQGPAWMKKKQRHSVLPERVQILRRLQFLSMIRGDDKQGVSIPGLLTRGDKKLFHRVICVTD